MSSILSLSSASNAQSLSGMSRLRQMLASEAIAVQPIRRVPGEQERRRSDDVSATDDALKSGNRTELGGAEGNRAGRAGSSSKFALDDAESDDRPVTGASPRLSATPNAGFIAQSIHQDAMGSGLHIEPWSTAITAYRKADAAAYAAGTSAGMSV
ncbi:hypothetical protein [Azospirillum baldaniorum]|nr:hypothetical protein [Azospirillum baldaniorum]